MFKSPSASQVVVSLVLASSSFAVVAVGDACAQKVVHEPMRGDDNARTEPAPAVAPQPVVGEKAWSPQKTAVPEAAETVPPAAPADVPASAAPTDRRAPPAASLPWNRPSGTPPAGEAATKPAPTAAPSKSASSAADRGRAATLEAMAAARAAAEEADRASDEGISDDRDVVKPVLARHPDSNLVICVAGCGPEPQIVQVLPKAESKSESEVLPSSANGGGKTADDASQKPSTGTVVCIAGCKSGRGEVVFKRARLSWIDPNESDAVRLGLRQIAERLSGELRVIATAEQSRTLTTWAGMGRLVIGSVARTSTVVDATDSADVPEPQR